MLLNYNYENYYFGVSFKIMLKIKKSNQQSMITKYNSFIIISIANVNTC